MTDSGRPVPNKYRRLSSPERDEPDAISVFTPHAPFENSEQSFDSTSFYTLRCLDNDDLLHVDPSSEILLSGKSPYLLHGINALKVQRLWSAFYSRLDSFAESPWLCMCCNADMGGIALHLNRSSNALEKRQRLDARLSLFRATGLIAVVAGARIKLSSDHVIAAKILIDSGADLNAADSAGYTALHHCFGRGFNDTTLEIAKLLLEGGANPNCINRFGHTPLFDACADNCYRGIKVLVSRGADPYVRGPTGATCLEIALFNPRVVKAILSASSETSHQQYLRTMMSLSQSYNCAQCGNSTCCSSCAGCLTEYYCDSNCQNQHWPKHAERCLEMQERNVICVLPHLCMDKCSKPPQVNAKLIMKIKVEVIV